MFQTTNKTQIRRSTHRSHQSDLKHELCFLQRNVMFQYSSVPLRESLSTPEIIILWEIFCMFQRKLLNLIHILQRLSKNAWFCEFTNSHGNCDLTLYFDLQPKLFRARDHSRKLSPLESVPFTLGSDYFLREYVSKRSHFLCPGI